MMGKKCNRCEFLEDQLEKARRELVDLTKFVNVLASDIYLIAAAAANEIEAGNVPRGRYEYLLAQYETANEILEKMNKPTASLNRGDRALFGGLFGSIKW